jgi:hypothetical protein
MTRISRPTAFDDHNLLVYILEESESYQPKVVVSHGQHIFRSFSLHRRPRPDGPDRCSCKVEPTGD